MATQTSERVPAARVAGVDGCKSRWLCITRDLRSGAIGARLFDSAAELADQEPLPDVIGWDNHQRQQRGAIGSDYEVTQRGREVTDFYCAGVSADPIMGNKYGNCANVLQ